MFNSLDFSPLYIIPRLDRTWNLEHLRLDMLGHVCAYNVLPCHGSNTFWGVESEISSCVREYGAYRGTSADFLYCNEINRLSGCSQAAPLWRIWGHAWTCASQCIANLVIGQFGWEPQKLTGAVLPRFSHSASRFFKSLQRWKPTLECKIIYNSIIQPI